MNYFDWDRSREELLTETRFSVSDIFNGTDYTIVRNPTQGEKMNNIYLQGSSRRSAYVVLVQTRQDFTFAFRIEYLPAIQMSGAKLGGLKEIKKNRCSYWKQYENISYDDLRLILSAFVNHS